MAEFDVYQTPHLKTALTGPLQLLEKKILSNHDKIEKWFQIEWEKSHPPIYGSVDLRNSGFKLAPVDMNLFPAGFNNLTLNPAFLTLSIEAAKQAILRINKNAKNILIIPENHTRNIFYWDNVATIVKILMDAGFETQVGSIANDVGVEINNKISVVPIEREGNKIKVNGFVPDVILLNNDLSDGIPDILKNLDQAIVPPAESGWSQRSKSEHFQHYAEVSDEFAKLIDIDPWLVAPLFRYCGEIDFMNRDGEECLAKHVEKLLASIQKKYDEYNIPHAPYVVVKSDAGTYGMAVMIVRSVEDIIGLNRKERTKMSKSKGGQPVDRVIIQEGVYTFETWGKDESTAEPVVYMWGEKVVGGFYRVHKERGIDENLNSPGMHFEPLAFAKTCQFSENLPDECQNRFYAYGVIARLSMLAAAREIKNIATNL